MSSKCQTILASRPAATVLALSLVAALTTPFVLLPRAQAAGGTPLACAENNNNGCLELSATPPEDTVSVPPNIVLMLDDSGSMAWNFMPDLCYLYGTPGAVNSKGQPQVPDGSNCGNTYSGGQPNYANLNNNALIDAANNGVYYDPTIVYTPPPKADGTSYANQTDITNVPIDGITAPGTTVNLTTYNGSGESFYNGGAGTGASDIIFNVTTNGPSQTNTEYNVSSGQCDSDFNNTTNAYNHTWTKTGGTKKNPTGTCVISYYTPESFFQYSTGPAAGPYVVYYVASPSSSCSYAPTPANCVTVADSSGKAAPAGMGAGNNVANWFAYYHTRILMAKSGLMTAFVNLNDKYRFGFGSIDGGGSGNNNYKNMPSTYQYKYADSYNGGSNYISGVQVFGKGVSGDQKTAFWNWISKAKASGGTPLRQALNAVGQYYMSTGTNSAWATMSSDPGYTSGSTTTFACRASYTIMTTDGFWNGTDPTSPTGLVGAANNNGPTYSPPAGKTYSVTGYTANQPFSGGTIGSGKYAVASLADVATYYWETDLQTGAGFANEVAPSPQDPAFWQHMTTFTMGLGFTPTGIAGTDSTGAAVTVPQIFDWAHALDAGQTPPAITGFSWATPSSNSINNISDLAHAAVNGHGDFFSAKSPQDLAAGFAKAIADINARNVLPTPAAVNASVLTVGTLTFETGYNTGDWSGSFKVVTLNSDGTIGGSVWPQDPDTLLNSTYHGSGYTGRNVYSDAYTLTTTGSVTSGTFKGGFQFNAGAYTTDTNTQFDATQLAGLKAPALSGVQDTVGARINYLLGDNSNEGKGAKYRTRTSSILGAILRSEPAYVAAPSGDYTNNWPSGSPEAVAAAASNGTDDKSYDAFQTDHANRVGTVYIGANDGMLHAFNAPAPKCTAFSGSTCSAFNYGTNPGKELWAFVPRAVYANLGNLTNANFNFLPTVDGTAVTRDVFFGENGHSEWHTMLAAGVGLGGRGVYALDITDPTSFSASNVMWEFDSDMTPSSGCVSVQGNASDSIGCRATDLGYTVPQPNIGRLANGRWVVLVPNGYFPDCGTPDTPTGTQTACQAIAAQAPTDSAGNPYSALFVMDAQTGAMIAELKTPNVSGVTSFGLATPVLGDYNNDQIDDVAFAGDAQGNLWRFDFSSASPSGWNVTLAYKGQPAVTGTTTGLQPITSMPRLFPDPVTNRFMVVFGTGKFLGLGDNSNNTVQAVYGVRDQGPSATSAAAYSLSNLTQQYLHETTPTSGPFAGNSLRCVTGKATDDCSSPSLPNAVPASSGGWYVNLQTKTSGGVVNDAGERVVVSPGAIFASNTVVLETLITGSASSDPCSPTTAGAIMALNAVNGGPGSVSSLGGGAIVGGRIDNARTSGSLPLVSALGGGQAYMPGMTLAPGGTTPISIDTPIWRRRSWNEIKQNP